MPRLFVALDLSASTREALAQLQRGLSGVRWTPPEQLHLTLRFIGDTEPDDVPTLKAALSGISSPPIDLNLAGADAFPNLRRPRVIVARVAPVPNLIGLWEQIDAAVTRLGFAPDRKAFRPHVTIGRVKRSPVAGIDRFAHDAAEVDRFRSTSVSLFASTLLPSGARHEKIMSIALE